MDLIKDLIKDFHNIAGKTIERVVSTSSFLVIVFTDKSYIFLNVEEGHYDEESYIGVQLDIDPYDLCQADILTEEEYNKIKSDQKKAKLFDIKQNELWELDRLKRKYEAQ